MKSIYSELGIKKINLISSLIIKELKKPRLSHPNLLRDRKGSSLIVGIPIQWLIEEELISGKKRLIIKTIKVDFWD